MPAAGVARISTGIVACVAAIAVASPAVADPGDPIPGNGVFRVGPEIAPGLYHSDGPSNPLIIVLGKVSDLSTCTWFTHSTPAATKEDVVDTNTSMGPLYVKIPATVAAFESLNCRPWTRVS
jgi:hypothetical protein